MQRALVCAFAGLVVFVIAYSGASFLTGSLTTPQVKDKNPPSLTDSVTSYAGKKLKQSLKDTPDESLEEGAEFATRKLYPIIKGILKGQFDAIISDTKRDEVPRKAYEAGKETSEKVVKPFAEGLAEGDSSALKELDKTVKDVRKFKEENKDVLDAVQQGLEELRKNLKELPPLPPLQPLPPPMLPPLPHAPGPPLFHPPTPGE